LLLLWWGREEARGEGARGEVSDERQSKRAVVSRDCGNAEPPIFSPISNSTIQIQRILSRFLSLSLSFSSYSLNRNYVTPVPHGTRKLAEKIDTSRHVGREKKFTLQRGFLEETSAIVGGLDRCIMGFFN